MSLRMSLAVYLFCQVNCNWSYMVSRVFLPISFCRPPDGYSGEDVFEYLISDGMGGTDVATVTVTVDPVNDPPIAADDSSSTNQGVPVSVSALSNDSDPENDPLTVIGISTALTLNGGTVTIMDDTAGTIQYT